MITHTVSFKYSGRMADLGAMDVGYVERATTGARLLLASHAHFVTSGDIPERVIGTTTNFRVLAVAPQRGSIELVFVVAIGGLAFEFLKGFAHGLGEEVGKHAYKVLLRKNMEAWLKEFAEKTRAWYEQPPRHQRVEPELPWPPLGLPDRFASAYANLDRKARAGVDMVASPIGREGGSSAIEVRIDGEFVSYVGEQKGDRQRSDQEVYRRIAEEIMRSRRR